MRVGIAHHLGWAVAVTADGDHAVIDRRRIDLVGPDVPTAPFEHDLKGLGDDEAAALIAQVRASVAATTRASLDELAASVAGPGATAIESLSVRSWPPDFPTDLAVLRRPPYDSRADSVLYCEVLAEVAATRGWEVHLYDAKSVEAEAGRVLGARADEVLFGPRKRLGAPWAKDHRMALAATVLAAGD